MGEDSTETKIGKLWFAIEGIRGNIKELSRAVFGNGVPGHEKRIKDLEDCMSRRMETCPYKKEKTGEQINRQIVIGLWINGLMMLTGFVALIITLG